MAKHLPRILVASIVLAAAMMSLAACTAESGILRTAGGPDQKMLVTVRDRLTGRPLAGAAVAVETTARDHPMSAASILGQTGPQSTRARTDKEGRAGLGVLEGREYRLVVWPQGRSVAVFSPHLLRAATGAWTAPDLPSDSSDSGVEIRIDIQLR